jgi:hypothetical protein
MFQSSYHGSYCMTGQEITAVMTLLGKNNRRCCNMQEHTKQPGTARGRQLG